LNFSFQGFYGERNQIENSESNRTSSWEFGDTENMTDTSPDDGVSEVMEFFEVAASLIRTLAPDSAPKTNPTTNSTAST
jgi:hypothetical protein